MKTKKILGVIAVLLFTIVAFCGIAAVIGLQQSRSRHSGGYANDPEIRIVDDNGTIGRVSISTLPLEEGLALSRGSFTFSGRVIYMVRDGADSIYYTCDDNGQNTLELCRISGRGGSRLLPFADNRRVLLGDYVLECPEGSTLDNCESMGACVALNYVKLYGCDNLKQIVLCDMTPKQLNDEEWKLGMYQGKYTKEEMERDEGKKFYSVFKKFAIGTIPKLGKIPGFLLRKPLKKILAECDESVLKSLALSMNAQDNRPIVERITVPVTYFYAEPGSLFSPKLARWYQEHVKTPYKAVRFPESTHMLISDYPEKFAREVIKVLGV